jgi:hypothetical protein
MKGWLKSCHFKYAVEVQMVLKKCCNGLWRVISRNVLNNCMNISTSVYMLMNSILKTSAPKGFFVEQI